MTPIRFGAFEVDAQSGELRRDGKKVKIQEQPFQVLTLLLERPGEVLTREELTSRLWSDQTNVDFERGLNKAITRLREALRDSAENPRYVETLPRRGYRFIAPVTNGAHDAEVETKSKEVPVTVSRTRRPRMAVLASVAVALGLILLAARGSYLLRPLPHLQPDNLAIVPFTTFPGLEVAPRFSPDGKQVVFSWFGYDKDFQFDLYVKQVGEERVVQLTHHPARFMASAWSPDGRFIAFKREAEPDASGIYLIPALGGAERKLAPITHFGGPERIAVTWSQDSKWVAFSEAGSPGTKAASSPEHYSIHLVNVETYEERTLPDPAPDCVETLHPAFSPDGKYLASMCALTEGVFKIYLQSQEGTQAREVTRVKSSEGFSDLTWAADGHSIVYAAGHHLWRVPVSGGRPEKLNFAQDAESVTVARAGNRLAYAQVRHPSSIWQLAVAGQRKSALAPTKLISSSRGDSGARISPDGQYIAFQSSRSGNAAVWISDRSGSNPLQLTFFGGAEVGAPSWAPDGRRVVFDARASDGPELYVANIEGGPPKVFPTGTANAADPFWSADGQWIYFSTEPFEDIWKAPVKGGGAVRLTEGGKGRFRPREAADGARVFFDRLINGHEEVWSVSASGGDERPVQGMPADVNWAPTLGGMYFIQGVPRHFSVNRFDFASQRVAKIADLPGLFAQWGPSVSADGRTFLISGIEHVEGDIVLVDGFR